MLRRTLLVLTLTACAGAAHAADRYGAGPANTKASDEAYQNGVVVPGKPLLNWGRKSPAPETRVSDPRNVGRPMAVSAWAKKAETERAARLGMPAPVYDQKPASNLPTSLYSPAPNAPALSAGAFNQSFRSTAARPKGQPIELAESAIPAAQPSIAQQQAKQEADDMMEAKLARARAQDAKDRAEGKVVINSQDAVR